MAAIEAPVSLPLYESFDGRFYVKFDRREAKFLIYDTQRYGWRAIAGSASAAEIMVDKLYRQHKEDV